MNLKHLAVFHAVAKAGSINQASKDIHITQPAISRQIHLLEDALGVILFDRLPRGVRLTEAGRILAEDARRIFSLAQQAKSSMQDIRSLASGRLSLGASSTIGNYLLPPMLTDYHRQHPGVDIDLAIGNTDFIQHQLLEDQIAVGLTEGFVDHAELLSDVFMRDELFIIASPQHPLAGRQMVDISDLSCHSFVLREEGSGTRAVLEDYMTRHHITLNHQMTLASTDAVKSAVRADAGIAAVSGLAIQCELDTGALVRIDVANMRLYRPLHLVHHCDRRESPAIRAWTRMLRASALMHPSMHRIQPPVSSP